MTRTLKTEGMLTLNRPFAIFVEPADVDEDGNLEWFAKIVGFELDNIVFGLTPQQAINDALDLLNTLTGKCTTMKPEHNWIVDTELEGTPAWECARCGEIAAKGEFHAET